jgi:hypothetical protein
MISISFRRFTSGFVARAFVAAFFLVTALFAALNSNAQTCVSPPTGLVGWWRGEGDALDQVGPTSGSLIGDTTFGTGEAGQGFVFDGLGDAIDVGNPARLQLQNFTIEAWIKRSSSSVASQEPWGGAIFVCTWGGYGLGVEDDGRLFLTKVGDSAVHSTSTITDADNFHHVAVTKNGDTVILYIDGVGESVGPYDPGFVFPGPAAIGARGSDYAGSFLGSIDEVSVYDHALDDTQIMSLYNAAQAGKCPGPFIISQPTNQTVSIGAVATFGVTAGGTPPLNYQWMFGGTNINNATNALLILTNVQLAQSGSYSVEVTNLDGVVLSSNALLTVNPTPACDSPPGGLLAWWRGEFNTLDQTGTNHGTLFGNMGYGSGMVGAGFVSDGNGDAIPVGNAPSLQLQDFTIEAWIQRNNSSQASVNSGGGLIFGFGAGGYAFGMLDNGRLFLTRVEVDNVTTTTGISDTALHHVAVTKNGTNAVFYIDGVAYAMPPYQTTYTFGTPAAIGARGDSLANSFWGMIDELSIYNRALAPQEVLAIYNAASGGKCSTATGPSITTQPASQSVRGGTNFSLSVIAAGSPALSYRWLFNGTNLLGATNYVITFPSFQSANAGSYRVIITNTSGSITSDVAVLTIETPPTINTQPQPQSVTPGSPAFFSVGVSGSPVLHFQWQLNSNNIAGANSYSLLIGSAQLSNVGAYTVVVTNVFGSVTSTPVALTLNLPPAITNQPVGLAVPAGANPSFRVVAGGTAPLKFQWRLGATTLSGATNSVLNLNNVSATNAGAYSVIVSNSFGTATSSNAFLVVTNPVCTSAPAGLVGWWQGEGASVDAVGGTPATLVGNTAVVAGKVGQAYSFDGNGDAVAVGNPVALQLQNLTIEAWIRRGTTTAGGVLFGYGNGGYALGLQTDGHPFLTQVGISQVTASFVVGDTNWHHVAMTKTGTNVVFYLDGDVFPAASSFGSVFQFNTPAAIGARGDDFSSGFLGSIDELSIFNRALSSTEVQALYNSTTQGKCATPLSWVNQPGSQTVTVGSNAVFSASVAGSRPVRFQWFLNGSSLGSATNNSLSLTNVGFFHAGNYSLTASNAAGPITSTNAMLSIQPLPLMANGSFESGTFTGWIVSDISSPLDPLAIHGAGYNSGYGFFSSAPTDGNFALTHGFDGNGPGRIRVAFDVFLPPSSPIYMTFTYRVAWDMLNYSGATLPRMFAVTVEPYGGGVGLQTNALLMALPGTANYDTGPLTGSVNLSAFSSRGVRISFDAYIPEAFTGPGFFQLDNVSFSYAPAPPLLVSRSGSNVVLFWPAVFSNFLPQVTTNLSAPNWSSIATNSIQFGQTNISISVPVVPGKFFYRLKSN